MEAIPYDKFLAGYIGIIMVMLILITMVLTITALVLLKANRVSLGKTLFHVLQAILWLILIYSLAYFIGGVMQGAVYWSVK